jgi:hypothetical protein
MLKLATALRNIIADYEVHPSEREMFTTILVSRTIAFGLTLPSSPVDNAFAFYEQVHIETVKSAVSAINEVQVIPVPLLLEQVRKVWATRYRMVFEPTSEEAFDLVQAIMNQDNALYAEKIIAFLANKGAKRGLGRAFRELSAAYRESITIPAATVAG